MLNPFLVTLIRFLTKVEGSPALACRASSPTCTPPPRARCQTLGMTTRRFRQCWLDTDAACHSASCMQSGWQAGLCCMISRIQPFRYLPVSGPLGDVALQSSDLPHLSLRCRYFGGDLQIFSMQGYGTDAFLHLLRLGSDEEPLPQ